MEYSYVKAYNAELSTDKYRNVLRGFLIILLEIIVDYH